MTLDVDAHGLEHFKLIALVVNLEDFGFVLLVEPCHGVFWLHGLSWMAQIRVAVCDLV